MSELIRELASINPDATPEELSNALVQELKSAIPKAIQRLRMPKPPSPAMARILELRLQRMRSQRRTATQKEQSSHERFLAELYQVRYSLNGHAVSGTSMPVARLWDTSPFTRTEIGEPDGQPSLTETAPPLKEPDLDSKNPPVVTRPHPYSLSHKETLTTRVRKFAFDESSVAGLEARTLYLRVAKSIEEAAREFAERSSTEWDFEISAESDIEIPTWKKWVLSVSCPVPDFEEKIRLWNELDKSVRSRMMSITKAHPDLLQEVRQFSRSFFLRMDLA